MDSIKKIVKRDGRTVDFDVNKIADAIFKAAQVLGGRDREMSMYLARQVELYLLEVCHNSTPTENCAKEGNGYAIINFYK